MDHQPVAEKCPLQFSYVSDTRTNAESEFLRFLKTCPDVDQKDVKDFESMNGGTINRIEQKDDTPNRRLVRGQSG